MSISLRLWDVVNCHANSGDGAIDGTQHAGVCRIFTTCRTTFASRAMRAIRWMEPHTAPMLIFNTSCQVENGGDVSDH